MVFSLLLAGCGGGGGGAAAPVQTPPPTVVTQTQTVGPAGGAVSAVLNGTTLTVNVPAGALSAGGTVGLTLYANSVAPRALHAAQRTVRTVGADSVLVAEFSVSLSGATLLKPLQAAISTAAAPAGSVFRLAGFGTSVDDVDTVTWAGGTATSDLNVVYPRMSLAAAGGTLYAFYSEPSAEATAAAKPIVSTSTSATLPIGMFGTAQFTASEVSPNGFPYLDPAFAFSLDNSTLGTIAAGSGAFTAGPLDGAGNVIVADTTAGRGSPNGKAAVSVTSQRPGNAGDSFTFSGTLSSTTQQTNNNITTQPQTDTASVALTSTVTGAQTIATPGPAVQTTTHADETDTYPLLSVKTGTDGSYAYVTGTAAGLPATIVPGTVLILGSLATDSNGVQYGTAYNPNNTVSGNGILDVLPEKTGPFGPNNAVLQYTEADQAGFSRSRTVAASGSYVEQGKDALGDVQTITVNADFSATYDARQYSGYLFTITAPSGSPAKIQVNIKRFFPSDPPTGTDRGTLTINSWIPSTVTQPSSETDVDNGTTSFPAACNVPAKYGTSGNQIVQTINRADTALGNLETLTTTTYIAGTVGPVCVQMSDVVKTFYDYTLQNGFLLLVSGNAQPLQTTTVTETLTLQSAKTSGGTVTQSTGRSVASTSRTGSTISPSAFAPVAFARGRFEQAVRAKLGWMRRQTFTSGFMSQGVHQL